MNNNTKNYLVNWVEEIENALLYSKVFCLALFDTKGKLLFANSTMNSLFNGDPAKSLINPNLKELLKLKTNKHLVFEGMLTIGNKSIKDTTIVAKIFKKNNELLVSGEVDYSQLNKQNLELNNLNREISNLQRQLIKEKKTLNNTLLELKNLYEEKNEFLGIAAHDLRNPIGTAYSLSSLIIKRINYTTEQENIRQLKMIQSLCKYSINLINDFLDFSKIESGKLNLTTSEGNYIELIKHICMLNEAFAKEKLIEIKLISHEIKIIFSYDSDKIQQVINNLISNAIKYSYPKTQITIKITQLKNRVKTEIIDQGQGISKEEQKLLFNPFQTTSTVSTAGEKSTGLGLAIVKKIIEGHNGKIGIKSELGKGSNFYFYLPVK